MPSPPIGQLATEKLRQEAKGAREARRRRVPLAMAGDSTIGSSTFQSIASARSSSSRSTARSAAAVAPQRRYRDDTISSSSTKSSASAQSNSSDASSVDESSWLEGPSDWTDHMMSYINGSKKVNDQNKAKLPVLTRVPAVETRALPAPPSPSPSPVAVSSRTVSDMQPSVEACETPQATPVSRPRSRLQPILAERTPTPAVIDAEKEEMRARLARLEASVAEKDQQLLAKDKTIDALHASIRETARSNDRYFDQVRESHTALVTEAEQQTVTRAALELRLEKAETEVERKKGREEVWRGRVEKLMAEVEKRGTACLHLWGQLEHPGEVDSKGRQKYTYQSDPGKVDHIVLK